MPQPIIPEYITVHLGAPDDRAARNVRVPFIDYIKNVASSEIYPTWPDSALRANIYAQISFALNRVYTEWYRSRGYDFDITASPRYDQKFIENRDYFDSVSRIVDELFNDYVVREGNVQPLFAQYCNGTTVTCEGLSQWGTVDLANEGLSPYEILQYYYGDGVNIVFNAPTQQPLPSYPGIALRLGSAGEDVRTIQRQLNRIAKNYPAIGPRLEVTGFYDVNTEAAVQSFQKIFNLDPDGVVGKATWYKIKSIYNGVKELSELKSEGLSFDEVSRIYAKALKPGDSGPQVKLIQYYLSVIAYFDENLPMPSGTGVYDEKTERAVREFQAQQGLAVDGIVGRDTWNALVRTYNQVLNSIPEQYLSASDEIYPGRFLAKGQSGSEVLALQSFLIKASQNNPQIPTVSKTGTYDDQTVAAVQAVQRLSGLPQNGVTGPLTWDAIVNFAGG